jgi:hypothetical protein
MFDWRKSSTIRDDAFVTGEASKCLDGCSSMAKDGEMVFGYCLLFPFICLIQKPRLTGGRKGTGEPIWLIIQ